MKNNLIDELFDKGKTYTAGILCTYSLDIEFFENYLLRLDGFAKCNNLCVFTDRSEYEKLFETGRNINYRWINKKYFLIPVDSKGVFHSKLYILASDKLVRIGIGSANLTREGLSSNLELASVFEISKGNLKNNGILQESLSFLTEIAFMSGSETAKKFLNNFSDLLQGFLTEGTSDNTYLLHNLEIDILKQVYNLLSKQEVKKVKVFSPFYDTNLFPLKCLMKYFPAAMVYFYIQQGKSNFPVDKFRLCKDCASVYLFKSQERYMHGKALIFETTDSNYLLTGSANFTESGLLRSNGTGNIETSIFGIIDDDVKDVLSNPNGYKPILLKDISDLETISIENVDQTQADELIIIDWLIEVFLSENQLQIVARNKEGMTPKFIFLNGNKNKAFEYSSKIDIFDTKKSEIFYAQLLGADMFGNTVVSGKVWVIDLDNTPGTYSRKRYTITDPIQIAEILKEIIEKGSEDELIEYLYRFNIPLDLRGLFLRSSGLRATESFGNVFGKITEQQARIWSCPRLYDAVNYFLESHYKKLQQHCEHIQLLNLNNFILIFSTMFNMMKSIHGLIISANDIDKPIEANEWSKIRYFYDTFLQYSQNSLELLWLSNGNINSFENRVNQEIKNDSQKMLGNISSFKEYIVKMDYDYYFLSCYKIVKGICWYVYNYIKNGKVLTKLGKEIRPMPIAKNGMRDIYIERRADIYRYVDKLMNELKR